MTEITIDVGEIATKEIAKRDRKIERQQAKITELENKVKRLETAFKEIKELRDQIVSTAYAVDDYFGYEGP